MSTLPDNHNHDHDHDHDGEHRPGSIRREHPELTEAAEVSARFAAQMLGGVLSSDPPPPGSVLAWMENEPNRTREALHAELRRRGINPETYWVPGMATDEDRKRFTGEFFLDDHDTTPGES